MNILITGINGQDGRLLHERYKTSNHRIFGIHRNGILIPENMKFSNSSLDILSPKEIRLFLNFAMPSRIFHLAASHANSRNMSLHGKYSEQEMFETHVTTTKAILDWQLENSVIQPRLITALSSQMYSASEDVTHVSEKTAISPTSKYGETKAQAFNLIQRYRSLNNVYAAGAILFNHSSKFSKSDFVMYEIARQIAAIIRGSSGEIQLQDFDSLIDVSDATEFCEAFIRMIELDNAEDFVLSSGKLTSLRALTESCLEYFGLKSQVKLVSKSQALGNSKHLVGDITKAYELLNWKPILTAPEVLIRIVEHLCEEPVSDNKN